MKGRYYCEMESPIYRQIIAEKLIIEGKQIKGTKKGEKMPRQKSYIFPVSLVFKTSNRSNAKTKIKVYKTRNVDEIIDDLEKGKLPGVPPKSEIITIGLGESMVKKYKQQYKL